MGKKKAKEKYYKFHFSVIIPIYNVGEYLEETIHSIIDQDIGFKDHIQLILVNDGSKDNSGDICCRYLELYPDNVIYLEQENAGVSEARNHGMAYVEGKYVSFIDGDDKWTSDSFSEIFGFFEENYKKIDVVSCKMVFFGASTASHILSNKFSVKRPRRIINIKKTFELIQLSAASSIFKADAIKEMKFNKELKYGEDALFINTLIMKKLRYGILTNAVYCYRKRIDHSSAIQSQSVSKDWYFGTPRLLYDSLVSKSIELYGEILLYIQYVIFYDMHWRLSTPLLEDLDEQEKAQYVDILRNVLQKYVSDFIILKHRNGSIDLKIFALKLKYGDLKPHVIFHNNILYFNNYTMINFQEDTYSTTLTRLEIKKNKLFLEAVVRCSILELLGDTQMFVRLAGVGRFEVKQKILPVVRYNTIYGINPRFVQISATCELTEGETYLVQPIIKFEKHFLATPSYKTGKFFPLSEVLENTYATFGNWVVRFAPKGIEISYSKKKLSSILSCERKLERELKDIGRKDMIRIRRKAFLVKLYCKLTKKKIWLLSDRDKSAGDNAEAFFKYLRKVKPAKVVPYFVIEKDCKDYKRLKSYGKVIPLSSEKNLVYTLAAHRIISSNGSDYTMNPFKKDRKFVSDLLGAKYIFLQHGITKDDISAWLSKYAKNIYTFITAAKAERLSILNGLYGYNRAEVALTGFARYDSLIELSQKIPKKKQLLVLPTWRKIIQNYPIEEGSENNDLDTAPYRLGFKETEFYQFYNSLIHDQRLLESMRKNGYTGLFALHPTINGQWRDFEGNDCFQIFHGNLNYPQVFSESSIMLTDFSSVFFDFAYLRRPIVYTHFDEETFYKYQAYDKGYFSYEDDGFGPVCMDLDSTVQELIQLIEKDGELEEFYRNRIDNFYAYNDANNCKRIYDEIMKR